MRRSDLGYALLLSVPVGVGVAIAVYQTAGGFPANPLALGGGLATTVAVFALVVAGVRPGSDAPERDAPDAQGGSVPADPSPPDRQTEDDR